LREKAEAILMESGALEECPDCESETVRTGDTDAESRAYAISTNRIKAGLIKADRATFVKIIGEMLDATPEHCPECDRREHRDD
jgi:ribosomal protein L37AE/L43A